MQQTVEGGHGTHIGEEAQFLTHGEQTRLWADGQSGIVVEAQIAYGSEEHGIGAHTHLMGAVGIGITTDIDGVGTTDGGLVFKLMSALLGNGVEHGYSLFHDLRSDTIALENRNFQFHNSFVLSFS